MKKIIFAVVMVATSLSLVAFTKKDKSNAGVTFTVTAQKSKVDWVGSKKSDYHTGYFPVKSGSVQVDGGKLVGGSFVIDVAGLKVTNVVVKNYKVTYLLATFLTLQNLAKLLLRSLK